MITKQALKGCCLLLAVCFFTGCQAAPTCPPTQPCPVTPSIVYPAPQVFTPLAQTYPYPATIPPPAPTIQPVFSPTPSITPTPFPTPTPLLPTVSPPVQTVAADHLPPITHDLLFISDPYLKKWGHLSGKIVTLAGPASIPSRGIPPGSVIDYSSSRDGKRIAITVFVGPQDRDYKIYLLDSTTGSQTPVFYASNSSWPLDLKMSPDGKWLAYILQDQWGTQPATATPSVLTITYKSPPRGGIAASGKIIAVRTDQPGTAIEVGYCAIKTFSDNILIPCRNLLWSPDSQSLAWSDGVGIWVANPGTPARLLLENQTGGKHLGNFYWQKTWSPAGHYLLTQARHVEGADRVIVDVSSGKSVEVPNSFAYTTPAAQMTWMLDERLFVVRPGRMDGGVAASGEIWRFNPSIVSVSLEGSFSIPMITSYPLEPIQLDEAHLGFAMFNSEFANDKDRGMFIFDMAHFQLSKVTGIMPLIAYDAMPKVSWAPDGSAVLISGDGVYLAPTDGSALYDLSTILGDAWKFTWIEAP